MDEKKTTELNNAVESMWDSLTDEQKAKAKECGSMDELAELAGAAGVELPDEMLDAVAGGKNKDNSQKLYCPYCKTTEPVNVFDLTTIRKNGNVMNLLLVKEFKCQKTGRNFYLEEKYMQYYNDQEMYFGDYVAPTKNGCG